MTMRTPTLRGARFTSGPSDYEAEELPTAPAGPLEACIVYGRAEIGKNLGYTNAD